MRTLHPRRLTLLLFILGDFVALPVVSAQMTGQSSQSKDTQKKYSKKEITDRRQSAGKAESALVETNLPGNS
jgi:hypothetical protein